MARLNAALQQALIIWRADLAHAQNGIGSIAEVDARQVPVIVTHTAGQAELHAAGLNAGEDPDGVVSGIIALKNLERLAALPSVVEIALQPAHKISLDSSVSEMRVPWKVPPTTPWPGKGAGAIVAIVDTGIDIFHDSFRKANGDTRILEYWDQAADATGPNKPPAGFSQVGQVYNSAMINASIAAGAPYIGRDTNGHGTHVAGIAAGNGRQDDRCSFPGRYVGVAPEADLVIVKAIAIAPVVGDSADGIRWCAAAPARLGVNKPIVINCSFGSVTGPHDGNSAYDRWIADTVQPPGGPAVPGLVIVAAAGNAGGLEVHETGMVAGNASVVVPFSIWGSAMKPCEIDIWYNGTATLSVELIAPESATVPGPNTTGPITEGASPASVALGLMTIGVVVNGPLSAHGMRKNITITISTPAGRAVRPGSWSLKLTTTTATAATWDAWCETKHGDAFPTFRMPGDPAHTLRRRMNTIDDPGTSKGAITVASYNNEDGVLAESSSRGPAVTPPGLPVGELKPTIAAPGVGIAAARSQDDKKEPSSCCDQKVIDKEGTSMASPHVAGLVALMLEKNRNLTFSEVRAHLQRTARVDGIPGDEASPVYDAALSTRFGPFWGSGKVDAAAALAAVTPASPPGGGGGGGGGTITFDDSLLGYTPHNYLTRLAEWRTRFGPRPGVMLFASLVSEHVDEILRLVNNNARVGAVWRRNGGPLLVRQLLHGPADHEVLLPRAVDGCDLPTLLDRLLPVLRRFGGARLQADIQRFGAFAVAWPGSDLGALDEHALRVAAAP